MIWTFRTKKINSFFFGHSSIFKLCLFWQCLLVSWSWVMSDRQMKELCTGKCQVNLDISRYLASTRYFFTHKVRLWCYISSGADLFDTCSFMIISVNIHVIHFCNGHEFTLFDKNNPFIKLNIFFTLNMKQRPNQKSYIHFKWLLGG